MKSLFTTAAALAMLAAAPALAVTKTDVLDNYANIAQANFGDALTLARVLDSAIGALVAHPSAENLQAAKTAWLASRVPYQQTEVYRFGNAIVDDWEGLVNAWPLDEGLIDYVDTSYGGATDENEYAALNVIANPEFVVGGQTVDASTINAELIGETLFEADEIESNVSRGYHAIEFLLWGQDLNGTEHGAGNRSWTDYAAGTDCTNGNCDRRGDYLVAASALLVTDLEWMVGQWGDAGDARTALLDDETAGISTILTGMGSLSYGEVAGERMRLGLMLNDPEEEHDCFSDNTHNSHYYDGLGVQNIYLGSYTGIDGVVVSGASVADLVGEADAEVAAALTADIAATMAALTKLKVAAEAGMSYDQMLAADNAAGNALIMGGVNGFVQQAKSTERAVNALALSAIEFEGSDSLDNPSAVFE
ncbi:MAG: peptidase [Rhodobacteraceae bacterium]|nr:peptidase [Paracoccaceae bacterium]